MKWTELLKSEIETSYRTTEKLLDKVDPNSLQWKPATGSNWMTMGQLLSMIMIIAGLLLWLMRAAQQTKLYLPPSGN